VLFAIHMTLIAESLIMLCTMRNVLTEKVTSNNSSLENHLNTSRLNQGIHKLEASSSGALSIKRFFQKLYYYVKLTCVSAYGQERNTQQKQKCTYYSTFRSVHKSSTPYVYSTQFQYSLLERIQQFGQLLSHSSLSPKLEC
jgi:hypothetical protein